MSTSTRERKIEFIRSCGHNALEKAASEMLRRKEASWLTDEQIDEITSQLVSDARYWQHHAMRERAKSKSRAA